MSTCKLVQYHPVAKRAPKKLARALMRFGNGQDVDQ